MIINSHAHALPDRLDMVAREKSLREHGYRLRPMNAQAVLADMADAGIDASLVFCIAHSPSAVKPANDFLMSISDNKKLFGFGAIHPAMDDWKGEIRRLKANGVKGIKFHSWFQKFDPCEDRMLEIYREMGDMVAYFHSGVESGAPPDVPQTGPESLARLVELAPGLKVVAAHFGGLQMLDAVRKHLVGKRIYLDTAYPPSFDELDRNLVLDIINTHDPDKILFGTDYPATDSKREIAAIRNLPVSEAVKEKVLWKNAAGLLGLG